MTKRMHNAHGSTGFKSTHNQCLSHKPFFFSFFSTTDLLPFCSSLPTSSATQIDRNSMASTRKLRSDGFFRDHQPTKESIDAVRKKTGDAYKSSVMPLVHLLTQPIDNMRPYGTNHRILACSLAG